MRVAVIVRHFPLPSQTFVRRHIDGLVDRGIAVDVYAVAGSAQVRFDARVRSAGPGRLRVLHRSDRPGLFAVISALKRGPAAPAFVSPVRQLLWTLRQHRPRSWSDLVARAAFSGAGRYDVIHAHFGRQGLLAVHLRDLGLIEGPIVVSFHGYDVHVVPRRDGLAVYQALFARGDGFISNTEFTAQRLQALGCPVDRLQILPVGLTIPPPRPLRPTLGHPVRILCVARLVEKKGIRYLLGALHELRHRPVVLDLVGEGPLRASLNKLAEELELGSRVRFLGARTEAAVQGLMRSADLFVLPSVTARNGDMEGQGLVLQEAQAHGLAVVTTRHNGLPEGMRDGETGIVVPEADASALAGAIACLLDDDALRNRMKAAAAEFVRPRYDIDRINRRLLSLYEAVIARSAPRSANR